MMKKLVALLLLAALCLSLMACSQPKSLKEALEEQASAYIKRAAAQRIQGDYIEEDVIIRDISKNGEIYTIQGTFLYVQDGAPLAVIFALEAKEVSPNEFTFKLLVFL